MYYSCIYYYDCRFLKLIWLFEIIELKKLYPWFGGGGGGTGNIHEKCIHSVQIQDTCLYWLRTLMN